MAAFPGEPSALTTILVVQNIARAKAWYLDVLGAELHGEYGGTSVVLKFVDAWILLVTGGGPTPDKPTVTLEPPGDPDRIDHLFTIRVADCHAAHTELERRGAVFLAPPVTSGPETRAFFRDPDGHLFEISEYRAAS
jgi:catechol 2,3-dioxygenase-like lactoylglutathione lyase family enzyme